MIKKIVLYFGFFAITLNANNIANNFNQLPTSPELFGSSDNFYLIKKGPYAKWANPSGIYTATKNLYFSHLDYVADIKSENLAGSFYLSKMKLQISAGFSYRYASDTKFASVKENVYKTLNTMSLYSTVLDIGGAYKLGKDFYIGILYKNMHAKIVDLTSTDSYIDAGFIMDNFLGDFNVGVSVKNILSDEIDKSIGLRIPLMSFFDILLGYNTSERINGFNVSGLLSIKDSLKFSLAFSNDVLTYCGMFFYKDVYDVAVSFQSTDIDMIMLLGLNIKI